MPSKINNLYNYKSFILLVIIFFLSCTICLNLSSHKAPVKKTDTHITVINSFDDYNSASAKETNETVNLYNSLSTYSHLFFILFLLVLFCNILNRLYALIYESIVYSFLFKKIYIFTRTFRI